MLTEFPVIHTNIWDAFYAIPIIVIAIILIKMFFKLPSSWLSTVAVVIGLAISILISHSGNLSAGIFMGFFYGAAAMGAIYSMKNSFRAYRAG